MQTVALLKEKKNVSLKHCYTPTLGGGQHCFMSKWTQEEKVLQCRPPNIIPHSWPFPFWESGWGRVWLPGFCKSTEELFSSVRKVAPVIKMLGFLPPRPRLLPVATQVNVQCGSAPPKTPGTVHPRNAVTLASLEVWAPEAPNHPTGSVSLRKLSWEDSANSLFFEGGDRLWKNFGTNDPRFLLPWDEGDSGKGKV